MRKTRTNKLITGRIIPGLNIQCPWAELIVTGKKTVETRFYPLPQKYVHQEIAVIETPGETGEFCARIIGIVKFGESFKYKDKKHFYRDQKKHLVAPDSPNFIWPAGGAKKKWGWPVLYVRRHEQALPVGLRRGIVYTNKIAIDNF